MGPIARLLIVAFCILSGLPPSEARRVALVIGNTDYSIGPLANPVRDAEAVAEAFGARLGFEKVILKTNLKADAFRAALLELSRESAGAEVAAVFFAGHGTEVNGKNYLIPVDARLAKSGDLGLEAIPLDLVLEQLAGATRLKLVILDACRNNLFPMAGGKRSVTRGLSRIEPEDNTLVVYAAKEGTTADDGAGAPHSPFTAALLKHIATPGLEVSFVFRRVRDDVVATTSPVQTPHVYGTLGGAEVFLKKGSGQLGLTPGQAVASPTSLPPRPSEAADAWAAVKDSGSMAQLEVIASRYKGTVYADLAMTRIAELKQKLALAAPLASHPKAEAGAGGVLNPKRSAIPLTAAEEVSLKPKDGFKECDACPEMVVVPAGSFMMGSPKSEEGRDTDEGPQRHVAFTFDFAVGKFALTFAEWDACVTMGGCKQYRPSDQDWGRGNQPVINVSWEDAKAYTSWLSTKTGKTYRLLSEAEREYVARAGTTTPFWWGSALTNQANHNFPRDATGAIAFVALKRTLPVDSFKPNPWGLFNVHGNVAEWVEDCWNRRYDDAPANGAAWYSGDCGRRVMRGGSWADYGARLRSANRDAQVITFRGSALGFRVARTLAR